MNNRINEPGIDATEIGELPGTDPGTGPGTGPGGVSRRRVVLGGAAAGVALPLLAACATGGGGGGDSAEDAPADGADDSGTGAPAGASADNPFGVDGSLPLEAVIFNGGYGDQYGLDAGTKYAEKFPEAEVNVWSTVNIQPELQPRFVAGDPPDVWDNSGAQKLGIEALISEGQIADLTDLLSAPMVDTEGTVEENLLPGSTDPGMFDGTFRGLNYVYTVYCLWYSASEFEEKGWNPPVTWDDVMAIGEAAAAEGRYLFSYGGQNASDYYRTLTLGMAAKMGGVEVLKSIDRLEEGAFLAEPVLAAHRAIEEAVTAGYFQPGGAGITHTDAQTQWVTGKSVMYPSGSWIENETAAQTPEGYQMTGCPDPELTNDQALPATAIQGTAAEAYYVAENAENPDGGREYLRILLSKEAASNFAELTKAPTIVANTIPEDGFGSTALASVNTMIAEAGDDTYSFRYHDWYGLGPESVTIWTELLSGRLGAQAACERQQELLDTVRNDDSITKFDVS